MLVTGAINLCTARIVKPLEYLPCEPQREEDGGDVIVIGYVVFGLLDAHRLRQHGMGIVLGIDAVCVLRVGQLRYAHVDERGDVVFYYVEGIGFDSRDMGDLLTPFTRKPDPDAEYQEYWGLSHVVKDGKIIYKGMRYNADLFEPRGDVNGDGAVSIADVTALIDMLIYGDTRAAADVNGDNRVSIADVTYLIDMLLGLQP